VNRKLIKLPSGRTDACTAADAGQLTPGKMLLRAGSQAECLRCAVD